MDVATETAANSSMYHPGWNIARKGALVLGGIELVARLLERVPNPDRHSMLPYLTGVHGLIQAAGYRYANVGGLPIDAFCHPDTELSGLDTPHPTMHVSETFTTPLIRTNWTVRDQDYILLGPADFEGVTQVPEAELVEVKKDLLRHIKTVAASRRERTPIVSVFSFDTQPSLVRTATILQPDGSLKLMQGNVEQALPATSMQTWNLQLPDDTSIQVLHPWEQFYRSMTRFSSGPKQKDRVKLHAMITKLRTTPGLAELESSELVCAYENYFQAMVGDSDTRGLLSSQGKLTPRTAGIVLARTGMQLGQYSKAVTLFVQATPSIFDRFVGAK